MAVTLVTTIKRFEGTAAEIAAFDLTGIPAGSTFLETDTGIIKVLDQAGALQPKYEQVKVAAGTNLIGKTVPVDADGDEKFTDTNPASVTLTGRIPEYSWFDGDMEPTPTEEFAFGVKFNTSTGAITVYGWSGTAWVGVA